MDVSKVRRYPVEKIRAMVEDSYKRGICDTTWMRWKRFVGIPPFELLLTALEAKCLIVYAQMKTQSPRGKHTYEQVLKKVQNTSNQALCLMLSTALKDAGVIRGSDLVTQILGMTGRKVALSSLYYWGNIYPELKFSKFRLYTHAEVDRWCEIATRWVPKAN